MDISCNQNNVDMIKRQTNYTEEEIIKKLLNHKNDPMAVIKEYLNIKEKPKKKTTLNQQIYTEIRNHMDNL